MHFLSKANIIRITAIFTVSTAYAVVRYNIFKGVEWEQIPLYVLNKSVSLTALALIAGSYVTGKLYWRNRFDMHALIQLRKSFAFFGYLLTGIHIMMSLSILNTYYFPKLHNEEMMNLKGEGSIFAGILAFSFFSLPALASFPGIDDRIGPDRWRKMQRMGYLGVLFVCLHVLIMGWSGWWDVSAWPGYLPPITLLSFILGIVPLTVYLLRIPVSPLRTP